MIPNILTTVRLAVVPFFAYFMLSGNASVAVALFVFSGLTDIVDGYVARHYDMITNFGMVYDPFVDKLMQITAVVCLVIKNLTPVWLLIFVLVKEITMIAIGGILYIKKIVVRSGKLGKLSTVIFYAGVILMILWREMPRPIVMTVVAVMIASMLIAAVYYCVDTLKNYNEKRI